MALNLTPLATKATDLFNNLPASLSIDMLWRYKQLGYELGLSNYDALEPLIQAHIDNAANLSEEELAILRMLTWPVKPIAPVWEEQVYYPYSGDVIVPDDCILLKISFQAGGGNSGKSGYTNWSSHNIYSGQGGGGGGCVIDFPMAVSPGATLSLSFGVSLGFNGLTVYKGNDGADVASATSPYVPTSTSGKGGTVEYLGSLIDDGVTAIKGGDAGTNPTASINAGSTSNGKIGGVAVPPGYYENYNNWKLYYGQPGGACGINNGQDSIAQDAYTPPAKDERAPLVGAGAASRAGIGTGTSTYQTWADSRPGGYSSGVTIKFVRNSLNA